MAKQKFYVVWSGKKPGIYTSWATCQKQVIGVKGARFKSYPTRALAEEAYQLGEDPSKDDSKNISPSSRSNYLIESISVDAACSGNPGDMEYRGVHTKDGEELFHYGPVPNGTNNVGEFLAIVHALAFLKRRKCTLPIYSDSQIALNWVRQKRANTSIENTTEHKEVWTLLDRAHHWLDQNHYANELLKWETDQWGEIKADFGRK